MVEIRKIQSDGKDSAELAYDLRQRYAKFVGDHLEDMAQKRDMKDYPAHFNALLNIYAIVNSNFKKEDDKKEKIKKISTKAIIDEKTGKKKFKAIKIIPTTYTNLKAKILKVSNEYPTVWRGESDQAEGVSVIEEALRDLENWLFSKMIESKMLGVKYEPKGLF